MMTNLESRYRQDPVFRAVTDSIRFALRGGQFELADVIDAGALAALLAERDKARCVDRQELLVKNPGKG